MNKTKLSPVRKNGTLKADTSVNEPITLQRMSIKTMSINLIGSSPLICHAWSQKAKQQMLDKQMKKSDTGKEAKDPDRDYQESLYKMPDGNGYGFPAVAFKSAAVDACSHIDGVTKVEARGAFHINGDMVKIDGTPNMRQDMVRIAMGKADVRFRGEFRQWSCTLTIRYNERVLSAEQIVNLFRIAGFAIGVGEWRPQRDGSFGMFNVE